MFIELLNNSTFTELHGVQFLQFRFGILLPSTNTNCCRRYPCETRLVMSWSYIAQVASLVSKCHWNKVMPVAGGISPLDNRWVPANIWNMARIKSNPCSLTMYHTVKRLLCLINLPFNTNWPRVHTCSFKLNLCTLQQDCFELPCHLKHFYLQDYECNTPF